MSCKTGLHKNTLDICIIKKVLSWGRILTDTVSALFDPIHKNKYSTQMQHICDKSEYVHF